MAEERYVFGSFEFDAAMLRLKHRDHDVALPRKSLETLRALVRRRGETVTRQELFDEVWEGSFVEDANLTVAVSTLRKALADFDRDSPYIRTIPTRGYRFVGALNADANNGSRTLHIDRHVVEHWTLTRQLISSGSRLAVAALVVAVIALSGLGAWWFKGASPVTARAALAAKAYDRGKDLLAKRRVCEAIPDLRESVADDGTLAEAHADLASALAMCDITPEADTEIELAKRLAPDSAEVLAVDGFLKMFRKWDWDGAETALRRAVTLEPNSARNHHWLGVYLSIRGWFNEAKGEMQRAVELEPDSPLYHADLAQLFYFTGDRDMANTEAKAALKMDPSFFFAHQYLRDIAIVAGDTSEAYRYEVARRRAMGNAPEGLGRLDTIFRQEGYAGVLRDEIGTMERQLEDKSFDPHGEAGIHFQLAFDYAVLKDKEHTVSALAHALDTNAVSRPFPMAYIAVDPRYSFLKGDERYERILTAMGLRKP